MGRAKGEKEKGREIKGGGKERRGVINEVKR